MAIKPWFGAAYLLLVVAVLACLVTDVNPVLILLRICFGLIYLFMIHGIVSAVLDRIALGQEALEAIEEQELRAQDTARHEGLRAILANIPPTDYILMKRN